ncbi:MAG: 23S rRNA (uracil(1939)-C(5))-methyltransferase RlmD, partial [Lachnospiraceae bacterium]|nr:23S rRNA (uracil(1939)-C(5))-methyltransferase RlmD [Lachnospiraceae bacterium]
MEKQDQTICPLAKKCGGCQLQGIEYKKQLEKKKKQVQQALPAGIQVRPVIGMEDPYHYRNKIHAAFGRTKKGEIIYGVYEAGTHKIVPVEHCLIQNEAADAILADIRDLLKSFKIKIYDEDSGYGLFRHVMIRTGHATGEILVVLVLASPILPSKNNFVKALIKKHPQITSIVLNVNERHTSMVLGERNITLYKKGYITDELCGNTYRISPSSFYQVNPIQTKALYETAIAYAGLTGTETVIDAYCGIGTIGMTAAAHAKNVIGVELNPSAVRDAIGNAKLNHCKNIRFVCADAGEYMKKLASNDEKTTIDVVFMDPPRSGSNEAFLSSAVRLAPARIVYISCGPDTLARDLKYLTKHGYRAEGVWPVDMFPWTGHVETVVLLSHKKPDGHINVKVEFGEGEGKVPLDDIAQRAESYKPKERVTYKMIKEYIEAKYGFKVHTAYIAEVKRDLGLPMYDA